MKNGQPIRVGVIGLGVGERHVDAYRAIPGCEVVAICDTDADHLEAVGDRYGIATRHSDSAAITEDPDIDAVSICSYDANHAEQALSALRHGKHVMVEKPIALTRADADALYAAHRETGLLISSNLILRTSPRFRALHDQVRAGAFGDVFYIEGDYIHQILHKITEGWRGRQTGYSVVYGGGIHLIDLMRWLVGAEVQEVAAMGNAMLTGDSPYPHEDTAVVILRFRNGALAKSLTTFGPQRPHFHALNLYGTKATFVNGVPEGRIYTSDDPSSGEPVVDAYPGYEKGDLLPEFVAAIREGRQPAVTTDDVFRVMDVCFAAVEAMRTGQTVTVDYLVEKPAARARATR